MEPHETVTGPQFTATEPQVEATEPQVATTKPDVTATEPQEVAEATEPQVAATKSNVAGTDFQVAATKSIVVETEPQVAATEATKSNVAGTEIQVAATKPNVVVGKEPRNVAATKPPNVTATTMTIPPVASPRISIQCEKTIDSRSSIPRTKTIRSRSSILRKPTVIISVSSLPKNDNSTWKYPFSSRKSMPKVDMDLGKERFVSSSTRPEMISSFQKRTKRYSFTSGIDQSKSVQKLSQQNKSFQNLTEQDYFNSRRKMFQKQTQQDCFTFTSPRTSVQKLTQQDNFSSWRTIFQMLTQRQKQTKQDYFTSSRPSTPPPPPPPLISSPPPPRSPLILPPPLLPSFNPIKIVYHYMERRKEKKAKVGMQLTKQCSAASSLTPPPPPHPPPPSPPPPPPPLPPVSKLARRNLEEKLTEVWEGLKQESLHIIGVVGIRGIGKTALLKEIHRKSINTCHDFDVVIRAIASDVPSKESIQDQILKELGFSNLAWKNIGQDERIRGIRDILSMTKFLLLLDDVIVPFDLSEVGVSIPLNRQSKVVFTTRFNTNNLFPAVADSHQKMVLVNALSQEEGYELFLEILGDATLLSHPEIPQLARRIADLCGGIPLIICTVGCALAGGQYDAWRSAARQLDESVTQVGISSNYPFPMLKLCYDHLENEDMRSCFKYCCLLPDDNVLNYDQLINYWVGEGFLEDSTEKSESRVRGYSIIQSLKGRSLLQGEGRDIQMDDIVRDFVFCIEDKYLVVAWQRLTKAPPSEEWREAKRISLMCNQIEELSESPECPNLLTLILSKNPLKKIEHGFFKFMTSLRVLDLSWCKIDELPTDIVSLTSLQYLNLSHTGIARLPVEFKNLVNLRVLDLSYMDELYAIPVGVIKSLQLLQVLDTFHSSPTNWIVERNELLVGSTEFMEELNRSEKLNQLGINIKDVRALNRLGDLKKLQDSTRSLLVVSCKHLKVFQLSTLQFMVHLDMLEINDCENLEEIKIDQLVLRGSYFYSLRHVKIVGCWSLKELTWIYLAPILEELIVEKCMNLKVVIGNQYMFPRLKNIHLNTLPVLTCISKTPISFPSLEEITVSYCPELKKFPIDSTSSNGHLRLIRGQRKWWNNLKWENESIKNVFLPLFKEIKS